MKKIKTVLLTLMLALLPINVFAAGSIKPSTSNLTITEGSTQIFKINASNSVGRVDISSSNTSVATVSTSSSWLENNSITITVKGVSVGSAKITVKLSDAATFDEEELNGSYTINVIVNDKNSSSGSSSSNTSSNTSSNKSKNTKLESLSVKGYKLSENYELTVSNNVEEIELEGKTEDSKATIIGLGKKKLEVGLNTFEVVVKAESGAKKTYAVKITRKDGFYLEDLETALKEENVNIIIRKDNNITGNYLQKIKDSQKIVNLNYYNEEKLLLYTWIIDGAKVDITEFNSNVNFSSEFITEIGKLSNYADGFYVDFEHAGNLPNGTKIKLYVSDKFEDDCIVNVYHFNKEENNLESIETGLKVKDGYVEFEINHCSDYFITMSTVGSMTQSSSVFLIVSIIEMIVIVVILVLDYLKLNPILKLKK